MAFRAQNVCFCHFRDVFETKDEADMQILPVFKNPKWLSSSKWPAAAGRSTLVGATKWSPFDFG